MDAVHRELVFNEKLAPKQPALWRFQLSEIRSSASSAAHDYSFIETNRYLTLAARMADGNQSVQDYCVLPRLDIQQAALRLCHHNGLSLDAFRLEDISGFFQLAARAPLRRAA